MKRNKEILHNEIIKYIIVGVFTTFIGIFLFYGSVWTFLNGNNAFQLQIANVISWSGSVFFAYFANRKYVFKNRNEKIAIEMLTFILVRIVMLFLDMGIMFLLTTILSGDYNIAKLISVTIVMIGNYVMSKILVFRN